MHKKHIIIVIFLIFSLIPETYAGDPHAIWGYCRDGHEGTSAVGATVFAYIEGRESEVVITNVGSNHEYLIDAGEFSRWDTGDIVAIKIEKGECYANKKIFLDAVGAQRVPDMAMTCPEQSNNTNNYEQHVEYADNFTGKAEDVAYQNISKTQKEEELQKEEEQPENYSLILGLIFVVIVIVAVLFIFIKKKQHAKEFVTEEISGKSLPKLTNEEIKITKALAVGGSKESEISQKFGPSASYTLEKLKKRGIVYFDDDNKVQMCMELKPKFIYEYILDKEQQNIAILLKKEGRLNQIEISRKVGVSRTTVSRRLKDLEGMDIFRRYADGTSNKIELSDWFRDNL